MNVLIIGGSGLLGSFTVTEAIKREHTVTVLSRGNIETGKELSSKVRYITGDIYHLSGPELKNILEGQEAVIYALGLDDRQLHNRPIYKILHNDHVNICLKIAKAARQSGVEKFVVFGSYFTYFDRLWPGLKLSEHHPYIKTRREQCEAVLKENQKGFNTFVLEIPYIFGSLPGMVPPWIFLFNMLSGKSNWAFFFKKGGTAAVTAHQIGQAAIGAIEQGIGGQAYPIGGINLSWIDLANRYFSTINQKKKLLNIPLNLFRTFGFLNSIPLFLQRKARGLNLARFARFQYMEAFIDPEPSMKALGYTHDDYNLVLSNMIHEWMSIDKKK